jgi:hypothetical protein
MGIGMVIRHASAMAACAAGIAIIAATAAADEMPLPAHWGAKHAKAPVARVGARHVRRVVADPPPPAEGEAIPYGFHPEFISGEGDRYAYYAGSFHGGFHYRGIYWVQPYWGLGQWQRWW